MNNVLVVITGPTASGKTGLAISLARKFGGEIISADSRAVYKDIDIASAKPTAVEMCGVVHWGIDLVSPGQRFTVSDFKKYADNKIDEILSRGKIPFLVGGTGLYIDAVLNDYQFGGDVDQEVRNELNQKTVNQLQQYLLERGHPLPENSKNKRYLVRAIERSYFVNSCNNNIKTKKYSSIVVGITTDRSELRSRINNRIVKMLKSGLVDEARKIGEKYGWQSEAMTANAYPIVKNFIDGFIDESQMIDRLSTRDWQLAKRQLTFMKRNSDIVWLDLNEAKCYISEKLHENK